MATIPINFDVLKDKHPSWRNFTSQFKKYPDYAFPTCTVQLSFALNRAGGDRELRVPGC
jgi:hypothetical protein